jgi:hypothetical protein
MSVQTVLLPVFVLVGLAFALLLWMAGMRRQALVTGETKMRDIALGQPNWPERAIQIGNCYRNQFEVPVLFLHPDRARAAAASRRSVRCADVLGVRDHAICPYRDIRHVKQCPSPRLRMVRGGAGAARDVDLLRAADFAPHLRRTTQPLSTRKF